MPRKSPEISVDLLQRLGVSATPSPRDAKLPEGRETRCLALRVVTPMFGGGVRTGELNDNQLISPKAVRGALRTWWRLTCARGLGSAEMFQRETAIFGSSKIPSSLDVEVQLTHRGERKEAAEFAPLYYAVFPFRENRNQGTRERIAACNLQFELRLTCPQASKHEVERAVSAWANFGGLGARTRRGLGALVSADLPLSQQQWRDFPAPFTRVLLGDKESDPMNALGAAIKAYQEFRQGFRGPLHRKTLGKGSTAQVPGRSKWPEPDSLRKITGCALRQEPPSGNPLIDCHNHETPVTPAGFELPAFPRLALGGPIITHFSDGPTGGHPRSDKDPPDFEIGPLRRSNVAKEAAECSRMSSPVLIRPILLDGAWRPAFLFLTLDPDFAGALVKPVKQVGNGTKYRFPITDVVDGRMAALTPMQGQASAIEALAKFLSSKKFK